MLWPPLLILIKFIFPFIDQFIFVPTVHNEYDWYSWKGGPPPGLGPVRGTAASSPPSPNQPPPASSPLQLPGLHHSCGWRQRNTFTCGRTSSLFCSRERRWGQWKSSGVAGVPGLLGLLCAGDGSEPDYCHNQRLPRWTGVWVHPDTSHRHGGIWLPLPLYSKKGGGRGEGKWLGVKTVCMMKDFDFIFWVWQESSHTVAAYTRAFSNVCMFCSVKHADNWCKLLYRKLLFYSNWTYI